MAQRDIHYFKFLVARNLKALSKKNQMGLIFWSLVIIILGQTGGVLHCAVFKKIDLIQEALHQFCLSKRHCIIFIVTSFLSFFLLPWKTRATCYMYLLFAKCLLQNVKCPYTE